MRFTVKSLLAIAFGAAVTVSLAQGAATLFALKRIDADVAIIVSNKVPTSVALTEMLGNSKDIRIAQYRALTAPIGDALAAERLHTANATLEASLKTYEQLIDSEREREIYAGFTSNWAVAQELWARVASLKSAGNQAAAAELFLGEGATAFNAADAAIEKDVEENAAETREVGDSTIADVWFGLTVSLVGLLLAICAGVFGSVVSFVRVVKPLGRMTSCMSAFADGDLARDVPDRGRRDEIGEMAAAVQVFKDGIIRNRQLEVETAQARLAATEQRKLAALKLADDFEKAIGGVVGMVSSAATEMQATAQQLTASAQQTSTQSAVVASGAEEASANVTSVAASAEQLGASVSEIGRQVERSAHMSRSAVGEAEQTAGIVSELSDAATRIDGIVSMISDIAAQTNLLALNATIEAARAGEAGRGFAVVAAEVKELANQTAKATAEIGQQISGIQITTGRAVKAIEAISTTIRDINETATAIASAVEEQGAATQEIVKAVAQASSGANEVTANISDVSRAADETGAGAGQVLSAASELATQSETLRREVQTFLATVRAA